MPDAIGGQVIVLRKGRKDQHVREGRGHRADGDGSAEPVDAEPTFREPVAG